MKYEMSVLQKEFTAFLTSLGTGKTSVRALLARLRDLFSWLGSHNLEPDAIQHQQTVKHYQEERGIHYRKNADNEISRIRRFLLYRNIIGLEKNNAPARKGSLTDVAAQFMLCLENAGYRANTLRHHYYALVDFIRFAEGLKITRLEELSTKVMHDYTGLVVSQAVKKRTAASMAQVIGTVKRLCRYALEEGYLLRDPMVRIRLPGHGRVISRNFLSKEELVCFFEAIDTSTLSGYTDRVLFELMYGAGLRISEALALRVEDIDFAESLVRVENSKGGKNRVIPLPELTLSCIRVYLQAVRPELLERRKVESELLFFNSRGKTLSEYWINHWLRFYARRAGITKKLSSHCFRYSYATHMLAAGIDIRQLAELMGHESLDTTAGYTKVLINDLKAELSSCHPGGGEEYTKIRFQGIER